MLELLLEDNRLQGNLDYEAFDYSTGLLRRRPGRTWPDIQTLARRLLAEATERGHSYDSLVLVGHSQGSLIIQRMIVEELRNGRAEGLRKIRAVALFASPNSGSPVALGARRALGWLTKNRQERGLRPLDEQLLNTQRELLIHAVRPIKQDAYNLPIPFRVFMGEADGVVPPASALGIFDDVVALPGDHATVIRPDGKRDLRYLALSRFLADAHHAPPVTPQTQPVSEPVAARRREEVSLPERRAANLGTIGRDGILQELVADLCRYRGAFAILGAPGIGKTSLADGAMRARQVVDYYARDRQLVHIAPGADPADLRRNVEQILTDWLPTELPTDPPRLLVLDNIESLWWPFPGEMEELLAHIARHEAVTLLVPVRGSKVPLGTPWRRLLPLEPLGPAASKELFLSIAGATFTTDLSLPTLLNRLGGLPMAIALVAHQAEAGLPLQLLTENWETVSTSLLMNYEAGEHAGDSLARSIRLSVDSPIMTPSARRLLAVVVMLPEGMSAGDLPHALFQVGAEAILAAGVLRRTGLIHVEDDRIKMLPPVRDYLVTLEEPEDADVACTRNRILTKTEPLLEGIGTVGGSIAEAKLRPEWRNMLFAMQGAFDIWDADRLQNFINSSQFFARHAGLTGLRPLLERAASNGAAGLALADAERALGDYLNDDGDTASALQAFARARTLYQTLANSSGEAMALQGRGIAVLRQGDRISAEAAFRQALTVHRKLGDRIEVANCLYNLAEVARVDGRDEVASSLYEEALHLSEAADKLLGQAECHLGLGQLTARDPKLSYEHLATAVRLYLQVGVSGPRLQGAVVSAITRGTPEFSTDVQKLISELLYADLEPATEWIVLNTHGFMLLLQGEGAAARRVLQDASAAAVRSSEVALTEYNMAIAQLMTGELSGCEARLEHLMHSQPLDRLGDDLLLLVAVWRDDAMAVDVQETASLDSASRSTLAVIKRA